MHGNLTFYKSFNVTLIVNYIRNYLLFVDNIKKYSRLKKLIPIILFKNYVRYKFIISNLFFLIKIKFYPSLIV
jgi:hypothetical protein